jgi:hypothetical protein
VKSEEGALSVELLKRLSRRHRWRETRRDSAPLCLNSFIDLLLSSSLVPRDLFRIQSMHSGDDVTYHFNVKSSSDINDSPCYGEETKRSECVILRDNVCTRYENVQWYGQKP